MKTASSRAYDRKQKAWRLWLAWSQEYLYQQYPSTNGSEHLIHNWYSCSPVESVRAAADAHRRHVWGRWERISARYQRIYQRAWARENPTNIHAARKLRELGLSR